MSAKITNHAFEYGTVKYFRGKADGVELCSYGKKKDPIGAKAYLDVENIVKREHLAEGTRIKIGTPVVIKLKDFAQNTVEENGKLKIFGIGLDIAEETSYSAGQKMDLRLRKIYLNLGPLKTMLNTDAGGARNFLAREGNDGRIVNEIWVVMSAELSYQFDTAKETTFGVSALGQQLEITTKGGSSGTQKIKLSPGTTFAYLMAKVDKWTDKDKTKIEDLENDYKGMN